jgi:hypothetical protein
LALPTSELHTTVVFATWAAWLHTSHHLLSRDGAFWALDSEKIMFENFIPEEKLGHEK